MDVIWIGATYSIWGKRLPGTLLVVVIFLEKLP
jgi:hypothetical protein